MIIEKFKIKKKLTLSFILFLHYFPVFLVLFIASIQIWNWCTSIRIIYFSSYINFSVIYENFKVKKKISVLLISIILIIFNTKNIVRINKELLRSDNHKFINFPFPPIK